MIIYPEYEIVKEKGVAVFKTHIRKLFNDKYYLILLKTSFVSNENDALKHFLMMAYQTIIFSKLSEDLVDGDGNKIFILDDNQQSEEKRLLPF